MIDFHKALAIYQLNPEVDSLCSGLITTKNYQIKRSFSLIDGFAEIMRNGFELVILDHSMKADGVTKLDIVKASFSANKKIILLSYFPKYLLQKFYCNMEGLGNYIDFVNPLFESINDMIAKIELLQASERLTDSEISKKVFSKMQNA